MNKRNSSTPYLTFEQSIYPSPHPKSTKSSSLSLPSHQRMVTGQITGGGNRNLVLMATVSSQKLVIVMLPPLKVKNGKKMDFPQFSSEPSLKRALRQKGVGPQGYSDADASIGPLHQYSKCNLFSPQKVPDGVNVVDE